MQIYFISGIQTDSGLVSEYPMRGPVEHTVESLYEAMQNISGLVPYEEFVKNLETLGDEVLVAEIRTGNTYRVMMTKYDARLYKGFMIHPDIENEPRVLH